MFTDIVLQRPGLSVIVDAKYYLTPLQPVRGGGDKLNSANLYQIYAYVKALARTQAGEVQGMLVYPTTSRHLNLEYEIDGHAIHVRTVDLLLPWRDIHDRLIEIAGGAGAACR
jgi:5-methylcytosine-specific restriction enzyme subunit McrC